MHGNVEFKRWLATALLALALLETLSPVLSSGRHMETSAYFFQATEENSPIARYLWLWIKWICYTLGGVAGAAGLVFGIFGFWVGRGQIIKQGIISAIAGFAFILVIPFVRIVFGEWISFAEEDPFLPEPTAFFTHGLERGRALLALLVGG